MFVTRLDTASYGGESFIDWFDVENFYRKTFS